MAVCAAQLWCDAFLVMEVNGDQAPEQVQEQLKRDLKADSEREHEFVSGYMALMRCTEPAARAVFMHSHQNGNGAPPKNGAPGPVSR